jgi:uncharacterized RmlC-like cupin family protein
MGQVRLSAGNELKETIPTPGMARREAFASEGAWVGVVRMEPGCASGWHHHGEYDSYLYVIEGRARFDFGPGGVDAIEAGEGDFVMIPAHTVHRETNPGSRESVVALFRVGAGTPVFNVDGPEASAD